MTGVMVTAGHDAATDNGDAVGESSGIRTAADALAVVASRLGMSDIATALGERDA